jgi:hypothetical protein
MKDEIKKIIEGCQSAIGDSFAVVDSDYNELAEDLEKFTQSQLEKEREDVKTLRLRLQKAEISKYDHEKSVTCTHCGQHFESFQAAEGHRCRIARN